VRLSGALTDAEVPEVRTALRLLHGHVLSRLVVEVRSLTSICAAALRGLVLAQQRVPADGNVIVIGAGPDVARALAQAGLAGAATIA
jgi:anti-anti-sigma regulatory factor